MVPAATIPGGAGRSSNRLLGTMGAMRLPPRLPPRRPPRLPPRLSQLPRRGATRIETPPPAPEPFRPREPLPPRTGQNAADAVAWPMRVTAAWSWRLLVVAVTVYAALQVLGRVAFVVYALLVALLLTALLAPAVAALRRLGVGRAASAALVFVGGIAAVSGIFYVLGNALASELPALVEQVEEGIGEIRAWLREGPLQMGQARIDRYVGEAQTWFSENQAELTTRTLGAAGTVGTFAAGIALTLFTTYFFLYDGRGIWRWVVRIFPRPAEEAVYEAGDRAWYTLVGYVRGVVLVAAIDGLGVGIWLAVIGVPLAVPLGILVFFGAFVPLVGALLTGLVAVLVALVTGGPVDALLALAGIIVVQQIEGNLLQPLILSRFVRLHPLAVALAVTVGGLVAGIGGAVVAVPIAAVINVVATYLSSRTGEAPAAGAEPEREAVGTPEGEEGPPPLAAPASKDDVRGAKDVR